MYFALFNIVILKNSKIDNFDSFESLIKIGDTDAFKIIFNTYYKRLYAFSLNYVSEGYIAEDIVENVLLKLWEKRHRIGEIDNLKSYLYTMVKNASIDYLKKKKKFVRLDIQKHDLSMANEQYVIEEETHAILFQALASLPEKCRKVFELSCIEGIKYKDIAEDLQISVNTVKSQRARAIELLKQCFKEKPFYQLFLMTL